MIDYIIKNQSQQQSQIEDWIPITDKILKWFKNDNFNEILENIQINGFDKLDEDTIQNLYTVISKRKNYFNINTLYSVESHEDDWNI